MKYLILIVLVLGLGGCDLVTYNKYKDNPEERAKVEKWAIEMRQKWNEEEQIEDEIIDKLIGKKKDNDFYNEDSYG